MSPLFLLRLEGGFVVLSALAGYALLGGSWWLFLAVLLGPDLFMVGYLIGPRLGAHLYNLGHTYAVPFGIGVGAVLSGSNLLGAVGLIWTAHIGMDRALGYGLKFPAGFWDTHLRSKPGTASGDSDGPFPSAVDLPKPTVRQRGGADSAGSESTPDGRSAKQWRRSRGLETGGGSMEGLGRTRNEEPRLRTGRGGENGKTGCTAVRWE